MAEDTKDLAPQDALTIALVVAAGLLAVDIATGGGLIRYLRMSLIPGPLTPEAESVLYDDEEVE